MIGTLNNSTRASKRFAIEETTLRELSPTEVDAVAGGLPVSITTITVTATITESSAVCTTITTIL